jgi:predicted metal-dependent peptidase
MMSQAPGSRGGYHGFWGEMDQRSDAEREVLEDWVDRQIVNSVNRLDSTDTWGDLPGSLIEYLKDFMKSRKPKVDWRRNLRLFTENSQQTYATNTMKKPSRRYKKIALWPDGSPMYEMKDGKLLRDSFGSYIPVWKPKYPGLKIRQKTRILAGIDTSGSLDIDEDLPMIFNELYHLARREVEITVVEIDEWIQRIYPFPHPEAVPEVKGRGGTDFNELLKYANGEEIVRSGEMHGRSHQGIQVWRGGRWVEESSARLREQIDGVVYFTDAQAATPTESVRVPILWVVGGSEALSATDERFEKLPGQKVIVEAS